MKIRVAFVIDFVYASTGGTENQLLALLRGLDRQRYEPHLVSLRCTPWLEEHGAALDASVRCFDIPKVRSWSAGAEFAALVRHLKRIRPHVTLTYFTLSNIAGVLAARLAGCREVWGTRRDFGVWYNNAFRGDLHFLKFADRFVRGIVTNAQAVKDLVVQVEGMDPARIRVIYNGIDTDTHAPQAIDRQAVRRALGIPGDGPVVGIVAGLRPMKRHETFLAAAREVLRARAGARFAVLGDGPLRARLEERARELGIAERVHFLGWRTDVRACLAAFDVGVNCSANEGLSNAIMEYMACGVPCVVSAAGGNAELVEDGVSGYLFPLDEVAVLANRVLSLLGGEGLKERFAAVGRRSIAERFSVAAMVGQYERLFQSGAAAGAGV